MNDRPRPATPNYAGAAAYGATAVFCGLATIVATLGLVSLDLSASPSGHGGLRLALFMLTLGSMGLSASSVYRCIHALTDHLTGPGHNPGDVHAHIHDHDYDHVHMHAHDLNRPHDRSHP